MIREKLVAYRDAIVDSASDTLRFRLSTDDAIILLGELDGVALNHPSKVTVAKAAIDALGEPPTKYIDAKLLYAARLEAAAALVWEAIEGQVVDGVTITRRQ